LVQSCGVPVRCAIVAPVPVPYRDPLFERLAARGRIAPRVVYLAAGQPGWDVPSDWFSSPSGYESEVLRSWQRRRPGRTPLMVARGLAAALERSSAEVVVSSEYGPATWRSLAWCRRNGRRLVIMSELTPWSDPMLSGLQRFVHRRLAPRVDGFVVFSSQGVARLAELGVPRERIEVSIQSADLDRVRAGAGSPERGAGPVRVLAVGRLVADKNFDALIEAFAAAGFAAGEAELELCGTGPLDVELSALAERLEVPLRLHGYVAPSELPALYRSADVLALVSTYEPFGVTVREAAAVGLPLICSERAGAAGDVAVDGENALVVDPTDRGAITDALSRLVRDPALRARLAAGSLAVTERHPLEADAEAFERAVLRAAGAAGRR
jgi:glycosyltransferase involved in cell wall biosynthesis